MAFYLESRNIEYNCAKHIPPTACESALNSTGLSAGAAAYETAICYAQLGCATRTSTLPLTFTSPIRSFFSPRQDR